MTLALDHVPFAWHDLESIRAEFDRLGLATEYGGVHDNDVTHMAVLGFDDRSYVELIAEREPGDHGFWPDHIRGDAGPAAWAVRVDDIEAECERMRRAGHAVQGPLYGARERDDGTLVEWDRAEFGDDQLLPFAIADRTPLAHRVSPTPSVAGGPLNGIGQVVLAVADPDGAIDTFRRTYDFPPPRRDRVDPFGTVASFPGQPVAIASPVDDGWLADRLEAFPPGPCACLLATDDLEAVQAGYPVAEPASWPDGRVTFFESERFRPLLGVVERDRS
jgi:hypothetical protein